METTATLTTGPIQHGRRRLSLRRVLTIVACIAAFFGFIRLASANGIGWATIPAVASAALTFGVMTRRYIWSFALVFILAFASHLTTSIMWDGGFPFAQLNIRILDEHGNPIENATLAVKRRPNGQSANGYPIAEYDGTPLASDSTGAIICHQTRSGLQFGGHAGYSFGVFQWEQRLHSMMCNLTTQNTPALLSQFGSSLIPNTHTFYEDFRKTTIDLNGNIEEIPIYEQRIVMFKH